MREIVGFSGQYRWLSNFWPSPMTIVGVYFPTAEHAYQGFKCVDPNELETLRHLLHPGEAKRYGRLVQVRADWNHVKRDAMGAVVYAKFTQNPDLRALLKATGEAELIEENNWGDTYWGTCRRKGENHLGKILMQVRSEL